MRAKTGELELPVGTIVTDINPSGLVDRQWCGVIPHVVRAVSIIIAETLDDAAHPQTFQFDKVDNEDNVIEIASITVPGDAEQHRVFLKQELSAKLLPGERIDMKNLNTDWAGSTGALVVALYLEASWENPENLVKVTVVP